MVGRVVSGLVATLFVAAACDSTGTPQASPSRSPAAEPTARPEPLPQADPPKVESNLSPEAIERCLFNERIDPADYAGVYSNVQELVAGQVEESRSLQFEAPAVEMLEVDAFEDAVAAIDIEFPEDEEVTTKFLGWALGLAPVGLNLNRFLAGNDPGLIAGFYDPDDQRIVIEKKGKLDSEYIVLAHEFTHAATDQAFGLFKKKLEPIIDDVLLARSALVEGDAALAELRVVSRLSPPKAVDKAVAAQVGFKKAFVQGRDAGVPNLLIDTGVFPYRWGMAFVCSVFKEKGWGGINRAYARPPTTTAQILFPERFLEREKAREPVELTKPGAEWQLRDQGQIGAAHLKAMFEAPGDNEDAALSRPLARAASWAGGEYRVWSLGDKAREYAVGLSLVEHEDHEGLLCSSMYRWYRAAFSEHRTLVADGTVRLEGSLQDAFLACRGRNVTLGVAPRLDIAREIMD